MVDNELNIVDVVADDIGDPVFAQDELNDGTASACEGCGYEMKDGWRACPQCGKVVKPFDMWEVLASIKDAPPKEKIEQLMTEKGFDIRLAVMDEDRVYLIIPVMRDKWKLLNGRVKGIKDDEDRQEKLMDLVVESSVIWPKPGTPAFGERAYTYATLYEQIMHISDFIPPQIAIQMVYKLG